MEPLLPRACPDGWTGLLLRVQDLHALQMVAEDSLVGSPGVPADDENRLEMERMPMG